MQLACICDNGGTLDIATAMQQQPYAVRGLLADAFFQCQQYIPDTLDFLQAERAVRDALLAFQGNQENYSRAYVLKRTLDARTLETPRADLIHSSFSRGGPVALAGIFYATFDAHRNLRSREVLDFLLNRASDESRLQLIMRASTFPCNRSMSGWLTRILDRLEPKCQNLASIIRCLGPTMSTSIIRRAREPSLTWGTNGEPVGVEPRLHSSIANIEQFNEALARLEYVGFVRRLEGRITMDPCTADLLRERFEQKGWIVEACRIVAHAFPKYYGLEPASYMDQCESLQPQVENLFSYLGDLQIATLVDQTCLVQLIETCLSTSYFRDKPWKSKAISIASDAVSVVNHAVERGFLVAMLDVRRSELAHLYQEPSRQNAPFPVVDHRSHAFSVENSLLQARECICLNALASAWEHLASFDPSWHGRVSSLGGVQSGRVSLMQARILRCEGRFQEAHGILTSLPHDNSKNTSLLGSVLCELGQYDEAIQRLDLHLATRATKRGVALVELALAHAHLFRCMHTLMKGDSLDRSSLQVSRSIFQRLADTTFPATFYGRIHHLSTRLGLAMVTHLEGQVEPALDAWQAALAVSKQCLPTGYTDMIISYSTSELEARRGATTQSDVFCSYARTLLARTGRQYHFVGLGTLWPDIIGRWLTTLGRHPVVLSHALHVFVPDAFLAVRSYTYKPQWS
ncbi:Uu.00g130310.m01.CDS01 [Anthostomella pinea]|uniref:Uu.00g130310.m01.CDS01 n=1 Tax=Anthostomella pinea TaxID=933095 RepID=A0AAI8VIR5_9PEZI|nr:Uu.00g130310.m01.CDS01 [Anthostomella pinea]